MTTKRGHEEERGGEINKNEQTPVLQLQRGKWIVYTER